MKKIVYLLFVIAFLVSCEVQGVKKSEKEIAKSNEVKEIQDEEQTSKKEAKIEASNPSKTKDIIENKIEEKPNDTLELNNGIKIIYFKKGTGEKLSKGDVVNIDYRVKLEDGLVYDGNHKVKKPFIPFLVGWNQQTIGWDIAMQELRVGDDVDVFLPAKYARGEKGIKGLVPPHSNNILSLRILDKPEPTRVVEGIKVWKYDEYKVPGKSVTEGDEVLINYFVSSESNPRYDNSYQSGKPYKIVVGDKNVVPGLNKALIGAKEGDRLMILIPSEEAYGKGGLAEMVAANEALFYDIQIAKVN